MLLVETGGVYSGKYHQSESAEITEWGVTMPDAARGIGPVESL